MTENQKLREAFEARMTDDGKWPNAIKKGRNGCYLLAQTENAWSEWKACAELIATSAQQDWAEATGLEVINCPNCGDLARSANPRQALALPTSAPVGERELPPLPDPTYIYHDAEQGEDDLFVFEESGAVDEGCPKCKRLYTADQMQAYARAALSAGDAVDAQRYRLWRDEYARNAGEEVSDFLIAIANCWIPSEVDAVIDAAMRKGQL